MNEEAEKYDDDPKRERMSEPPLNEWHGRDKRVRAKQRKDRSKGAGLRRKRYKAKRANKRGG